MRCTYGDTSDWKQWGGEVNYTDEYQRNNCCYALAAVLDDDYLDCWTCF